MTEKQEAFLAALFTKECKGDIRKAMRVAGYSDASPLSMVTDPLSEQIADLTRKYMAAGAAKAAYELVEIMNNPIQPGIKDKAGAAKDVLDRAGFQKTDKVEVKTDNPLFILPAKDA